MDNFLNISTTDPNELEATLTPIMGNFKVCPFKTKYHSDINGRKLDRLAVFSVKANESRGFVEPPHKHVGLYLPLAGCFVATENKRTTCFDHDIHLLRSDREFSHTLNPECRILATNIFVEPLQAYVHKLTGSDVSRIPDIGNRIVVSSAGGQMLARNLIRLWSELNHPGADPGPHISIAELEDELIASYVMATETIQIRCGRSETIAIKRAMACAEEYLDSNLTEAVSNADLAAASGVSIRTLSRAFLNRHGTGPMGFLRARRLYAAYRQLLAAEADSTTVTAVAVNHGFNHLGKFAVSCKRTFGESPSVTLNR